MSGGDKGFKAHVVSFFIWIFKGFKNLIHGIFGFFNNKLTKEDSETRQWFKWYIGDKRDLEKFLKWGLFIATAVVFVTIGIFKFNPGGADYKIDEGVNNQIINPSRENNDIGKGQLDFVSMNLEEEAPSLDMSEDDATSSVGDDLLSKLIEEGSLTEEEAATLRKEIEDGNVSGTRQENQKRLKLLEENTPGFVKEVIQDNLKYGNDDSLTTAISDAAISSDKAEREAAEIVADPSSDSALANFLTKFLQNRLSNEEQDRIRSLLRFDANDLDAPLRDAALLLASSDNEEDHKDAQTLLDYLRRRNTDNKEKAMFVLDKHFPDLKDIMFNSAYPPNKIRELAKKRLEELYTQRGKLAEEGYESEEGIFGRVLNDTKINLNEYDKLKEASRDTKDKNSIYKNLFGEHVLSDQVNLKGNEEALARHALNTDDPEIKRIIEKLLRGEELTEEELARLKDYLLENDPELFRKLFGDHAYQMHKLKNLLKDDELRAKVASAIDRARELGFYEEAELLDRLLAGEDLSEEELARLKDYLAENEPDLFNELFAEEEYYVDSTGRKLTRAELEALRQIRNGLDDESSELQGRVLFTGEEPSYMKYSSQSESIGEDTIFTADQSFKAILNTHIVLSDKESSINYRYEMTLMEDMISKKGRMVAPKGSKIIGVVNAGGVNFDTKILSVNASVVSLHDRDIEVNFTAGSGNGAMGIKGQVWDHKEKKWVGMIVSALGAGVADTANQIIQRDFVLEQDNVTIPTAMPSILLGGATEVLTKISEQVGQDLQNAPRFFQVPPQTPVILYPGTL